MTIRNILVEPVATKVVETEADEPDQRRIQVAVLKRCVPYVVLLCLASFCFGFAALHVMDECWHMVIQLDYLAIACNITGAIGLYRHTGSGKQLGIPDWQLAVAFYLPWLCATYLQTAFFSCGDEARDGYYSTRLVYFSYRALLSIPLMCPYECALAELVVSGLVGLHAQSSEARASMMAIEIAFLLLIFIGVTIFAQRLVEWGFRNAQRAESALSAAVEARHGLIEKLCDAEVELSGALGMLEASSSWSALIGVNLSEFHGNFLDVVAESDLERVSQFLSSAGQLGASSCIHATLAPADGSHLEVRIYHASQSGRSDACRHRLAVIVLNNFEPKRAASSICNDSEDRLSFREEVQASQASEAPLFPSDCEGIFSEGDGLGPKNHDSAGSDGEISDTLICSESACGKSQATGTWVPASEHGSFRTSLYSGSGSKPGNSRRPTARSTKTQTDAELASSSNVPTCDAACQTMGIVKPPALPQTATAPISPSGRTRSSLSEDKKSSSSRKVVARNLKFAGDVVPGKRLILPSTCQLLLLEMAKKMNVRGCGCCAVHVSLAYLVKTLKSMHKSPCREMEYHSDWQCAVCHALHTYDEDEDLEESCKMWCEVCGSTEVPADVEASSARSGEVMSDGPPSTASGSLEPSLFVEG